MTQLRALTHIVSPQIAQCELTFVGRSAIDLALAERQHRHYCETLVSLGVEVITLSGNVAFADACFVEDTAIVAGQSALITSMGVASRRGETPLIAEALGKYLELSRVELPATLEGGDVLRVGTTFFAGLSSRTNAAGIQALKAWAEPLGYRVVPVATEASLHLKSACTAIDDQTLLLNPEWLDSSVFKGLKIIPVAPEEPAAANVLRVEQHLCVQTGFPRTAEKLQALGKSVVWMDTSELSKAEGALTCLSILF
ncbi:MAG: dimethylarginine dimethylaminohydrolase family protein [Candidatus Sericytochromatia bacterium]